LIADVFNPLDCKGNYSATSNNMVGTLVAGGWAVTFGTARRGLGGAAACPGPPRCAKCNSPLINDQCTSHGIAVKWSIVLRF